MVQATLEMKVFSVLSRASRQGPFPFVRLEQGGFRLILADYTTSSVSTAISALKLARGISHDVPFILLSGTWTKNVPLTPLKMGANRSGQARYPDRTVGASRVTRAQERAELGRGLETRSGEVSYLCQKRRISPDGSVLSGGVVGEGGGKCFDPGEIFGFNETFRSLEYDEQ